MKKFVSPRTAKKKKNAINIYIYTHREKSRSPALMLEMGKRAIYHSLGLGVLCLFFFFICWMYLPSGRKRLSLECLQDHDKKHLVKQSTFQSFCLPQLQDTVFHKLDILCLGERWKFHNPKVWLEL